VKEEKKKQIPFTTFTTFILLRSGKKRANNAWSFPKRTPNKKQSEKKKINISITLHWGEIEDSFQRGLFGKKNANSGKSFKSSPPAKNKKQREKKKINPSMSLVLEGENWGLF